MTAAATTRLVTIGYFYRTKSVCVRKNCGPLGRGLVSLVGEFHEMFRIRLGRCLPRKLPDSVETQTEAFLVFATFELVSRLYAKTNDAGRRDEKPRLVSAPTLTAEVVWEHVQAGQGVELLRQLLNRSLCSADRHALAAQLLALLKDRWEEIHDQNRRPAFYCRPGLVTLSLNEKGVVEAKFTSMTASPTIETWVRLHERQLRTYLAPRGNTNACVATH